MLSNKRVACLVTGATRGLGNHIAHALALEIGPDSALIISGRDLDQLNKVRQEILDNVGNKKIRIHPVQWDFRNPNVDQYENDLIKSLTESNSARNFEAAVIVHNAAEIGDLTKKVTEFKNAQELQNHLNINLVSLLVLNSVWLEQVKNVHKKVVVNLTAPSATIPRPSMGMTCMVKSSRQLTLSVLAKESPEIKVLHFDPGAIDTDSLRALRDVSYSKDIREWIAGFYNRGELLEGNDVAKALIKTLNDDKYESAAYVDAYNIVGK